MSEVMRIATATDVQNDFGKYLQYAIDNEEVELRLLHMVGIVMHPSENITSHVLLDVDPNQVEAALIDMCVRPGTTKDERADVTC